MCVRYPAFYCQQMLGNFPCGIAHSIVRLWWLCNTLITGNHVSRLVCTPGHALGICNPWVVCKDFWDVLLYMMYMYMPVYNFLEWSKLTCQYIHVHTYMTYYTLKIEVHKCIIYTVGIIIVTCTYMCICVCTIARCILTVCTCIWQIPIIKTQDQNTGKIIMTETMNILCIMYMYIIIIMYMYVCICVFVLYRHTNT